jgi:hypothetical protein
VSPGLTCKERNAAAGAYGTNDTVVVPASASHYALGSGEIQIAKPLTIQGVGGRIASVIPDQPEHFGDAQAGVEHRRDHQPVARRAGFQQPLDLCAAQHALASTRRARALVGLELINGVDGDPGCDGRSG